jgi:hypothetical protein
MTASKLNYQGIVDWAQARLYSQTPPDAQSVQFGAEAAPALKERKALRRELGARAFITDREHFLLGVIRYLDDMDCWYLDEAPEMVTVLDADFAFNRNQEEETDE